MTYTMKPLACDPTRIKGMSEKLLVSHYENNYGGAVNRLNAIAVVPVVWTASGEE
jgi:superoxide dismutase, Fe-Mn family